MSDVRHAVTVEASPQTVYGILAEATRWPETFRPTVHVEQLERTEIGAGVSERIKIWAVAGEEVKCWTSVRDLDPEGLRISFRQEVSQPPVAAMSGAWSMQPLADGGTELVLEHSFRAVDDDPAALTWIEEVTDRNSRTELADIKALAEQATQRAELELTFEDSIVASGRANDVYDFLNQAELWPDRLPHVSRMELNEEQPGVQVMEMDTVTANGDRHTTKSVRVCFPGERIVYKQTVVPALMTAHTGEWRIRSVDRGYEITSRHTVVIRPETVSTVLGADATVADAREFVRRALTGNSRLTLEHAKAFADNRAVSTAQS